VSYKKEKTYMHVLFALYVTYEALKISWSRLLWTASISRRAEVPKTEDRISVERLVRVPPTSEPRFRKPTFVVMVYSRKKKQRKRGRSKNFDACEERYGAYQNLQF